MTKLQLPLVVLISIGILALCVDRFGTSNVLAGVIAFGLAYILARGLS